MKYVRSIAVLCLPLIMVGLAGCFYSNPKDIEAFLRPDLVDVTTDNYVLQPPDEVEVHCSKVPEIHLQRQRIRPDGKISFESLGEIQAAGKTVEQVSSSLQKKVLELYKLEGKKPIDLRIVMYRSKVFHVYGQVYFSGPMEYTGRDTVLTALSKARIQVGAWEEHTRVIRPSRDKNVKPKIFEVDYKKMIQEGDTSKDVLLQEGDIIYVPPTILTAIAMVVEEFVTPIGRAFSTVNIVQGPPQYRQ